MKLFAIVCVVFAAFAASADKPAVRKTVENGPIITIGGKGKLAVVNTCGADEAAIALATKKFGNVLMIRSELQKGKWTLATAADDFKATGANVAVFIVRDATLPLSLVAMESRWGVVNAEGLTSTQLAKEFMRVSLVLLGGAYSKFSASVMQPVASREGLDAVGETITFDAIMSIHPQLEKLGFEQFSVMSYRDACEEGVAPAPKTDVERKIAEEVRGGK